MRLRDRKITFGKYQRKVNMGSTIAMSYPCPTLEGLGSSACSEVALVSVLGWLEKPHHAGPYAHGASTSSQNSEPSPWGCGLS